MIHATVNKPPKRKKSSIICRRVHSWRGFLIQRTRDGVIMTAPTRSPSHQVDQIELNRDHDARPPTLRIVVPIVALTVAAKAAKSANLKMLCDRSKTLRPSA